MIDIVPVMVYTMCKNRGVIMEYITVKQAAEQWGLSDRRVRLLCEQNKIPGVVREGRSYRVPINAIKPADGRIMRGKIVPQEYSVLFARVDALKTEIGKR